MNCASCTEPDHCCLWHANVVAACAPDLGISQGPRTEAAGEGAAVTISCRVLQHDI